MSGYIDRLTSRLQGKSLQSEKMPLLDEDGEVNVKDDFTPAEYVLRANGADDYVEKPYPGPVDSNSWEHNDTHRISDYSQAESVNDCIEGGPGKGASSSTSSGFSSSKDEVCESDTNDQVALEMPRRSGYDGDNTRTIVSNTAITSRHPDTSSRQSVHDIQDNSKYLKQRSDGPSLKSTESYHESVTPTVHRNIGGNDEGGEMIFLMPCGPSTEAAYPVEVGPHADTPLLGNDTVRQDRSNLSTEGVEEVSVLVYTEEQPCLMSCDIPKLVLSSTDALIYGFDPRILLEKVTRQCKIASVHMAMFGLWMGTNEKWIILSELSRFADDLELRIRFTVTIPLAPQISSEGNNNNNYEDEGIVAAFPPMSFDVLKYLFHQRRHQFHQSFVEVSKDSDLNDGFLKHVLPVAPRNEDVDDRDYVLYLAVLDELRKRIDAGLSNQLSSKRCLAKHIRDILPKSMCNDFKSYKWYHFWKNLDIKILWERFFHLLDTAIKQLGSVKKEVLFVAYINHVEKLETRFNSEVYSLAGNEGAVCINGQRGVVMATDRLDVLGLDDDFDCTNNCVDGVQIKVNDEATVLELSFDDIAELQTSQSDEKKIFLCDILGNRLSFRFECADDRVRFLESVNQYSKLVVDRYSEFPCMKDTILRELCFIHEGIREKFLYEALKKHPCQFGCAYRRKSHNSEKCDVFVKTFENDEISIRRTSIERNEEGRVVLTDCENAEIEADSFEEFIEKTETDRERVRDILGDVICNALGNVVKPSDIEQCALLRTRKYTENNERKEMALLNDGQFGAVMDVFTGDFTMSMITKFAENSYVHLVRILEMRERRQSFANELEEAMDLLFPVRHHRHIAKQIGIGVSYDWKVLEYSQWGNLSTYFMRRAIRGAEMQSDRMVITGDWLIKIFYQLAHALNYMATKNLAHGGIRADNVLIFRTNPDPVIKLGHPGIRFRDIDRGSPNCTQKSAVPSLPRPWLAKELCTIFNSERKVTLEADVWAFASCVLEIITYARKGRSFLHVSKWGDTRTKASQHLDKKYEGASHVCKIAPIPCWLEYTTREECRELFGDKLQRCWSKNPSLRPHIRELFLAISLLVRDEAGKDEKIFPDGPVQTSKSLPVEIPSFSDRDLVRIKDLNTGKFGTVSLYQQLSVRRTYAVKDTKNVDAESMKSFVNELRTMLRINHKNIVRIEGMTVPSQRIVMEHVKGGSLQENFERPNYFAQSELVEFALDIAEGLQALHRDNILHRDLAARNVLLKSNGDGDRRLTAVISDFGLSRAVDSNYYRPDTTKFVPAFWYPPKEGSFYFTKMTDVYSYGVTLWEMFARRTPTHLPPLENPGLCPIKIYHEVMSCCWRVTPNHRIELDDIIAILTEHIQKTSP